MLDTTEVIREDGGARAAAHPLDIGAAIIDLDGTMVDTAPDFLVVANQVRAEHGLSPWSLRQVADCIGKGPENLVRQLLLRDLHPAVLAQRLPEALASFARHYDAVNGRHAQVFPGVRDGIEAMRDAGLQLACVTNKPRVQALRLLEQAGLLPAFALVYGGDSFARKKPDPLPVLRACDALGLRPAEVVLIGDSSNDAAAARAAGCTVLLVPYGYNHGAPVTAAGADAIVPDLHAAARLLLSRSLSRASR